MSETIDLRKICRLCLKNVKDQNELINIFNNDENCSLPMRIMACSALEVSQNDALPKNMCVECRYGLEKFYLFRKISKNADTKLRRHLRLLNTGKVSNIFEDDEDDDEYEESIAILAKRENDQVVQDTRHEERRSQILQNEWNLDKRRWELEKRQWELDKMKWLEEIEHLQNITREKEEECENILNQTEAQSFEVDNSFHELLIKNEPNIKVNSPITENGTRPLTESSEVGEEYSETLLVLETSDNYENYEMITDEPPYHNSMFDEEESETSDGVERDDQNYILSGNDNIEISYAEASAENDNIRESEDDYTNTEYLEIDDEETKDDEESIPLEYNTISKAIRNTIASRTGITSDREGVEYKLLKKNGKTIRIAVTQSADPNKIFYVGIHENSNDSDTKKRKAHICSICNKLFTSSLDLNRHEENVHGKKRGQHCEFCSKWFPSRSSLLRHVRIHTGEKPFGCEECGKSFVQKEILKRHMMIHTGERPHQCNFCERGFVQRDMLKQHINRKHSKNPIINLHKCQQCSKAFHHASGLSRHSLVHSGKKFDCEYCSKPFSDKSAMKRHVASLHASRLKIET